jgi:hypothetical protein
VLAVGNVPLPALTRLLEALGAGDAGDTHVVITGACACVLGACVLCAA